MKVFKYGPLSSHTAFVYGNHTKHVVAVGGLTCGHLFTEYVPLLANSLDACDWSLVCPLLRSSHQGWGCSSITEDVDDLMLLSRALKNDFQSSDMVIVGHSTGCQDAVAFSRATKDDDECSAKYPRLVGVILQAPVSDREYLDTLPETRNRVALCKEMVKEGRGNEVAFRAWEVDGAPVSANRWLSLTQRRGEDDMFSYDFSDDELCEVLAGLRGVPTLVMMSGADEYQVPLEPEVMGLRIAKAIGDTGKHLVIDGGNHDLSNKAEKACKEIMNFITCLDA